MLHLRYPCYAPGSWHIKTLNGEEQTERKTGRELRQMMRCNSTLVSDGSGCVVTEYFLNVRIFISKNTNFFKQALEVVSFRKWKWKQKYYSRNFSIYDVFEIVSNKPFYWFQSINPKAKPNKHLLYLLKRQ